MIISNFMIIFFINISDYQILFKNKVDIIQKKTSGKLLFTAGYNIT